MPPQSKAHELKLTASAALLKVRPRLFVPFSTVGKQDVRNEYVEKVQKHLNTEGKYLKYLKVKAKVFNYLSTATGASRENTQPNISSTEANVSDNESPPNIEEDENLPKKSNANGKSLITHASTSANEDDLLQFIISALSQSEIETAARSSYEYYKYAESSSDGNVDDDIRIMYAMKMAKRHLIAEKGNKNAALQKMKSTIKFREEMDIDAMRQCFYNLNYDDDSSSSVELRKGLEKELSDGKHIVRGNDQQKHSFFLIFPRNYTSFDKDWYLKGKLYSLERAIAYSERISAGAVEKVNVVFDYNGYIPDQHDPPLALIKELLYCLRDHYPERLKHMFFVDAPFRFRAFWALVKPFIDPDTKRKIQFVSGDSQKQNTFNDLVSPEMSMSFMHKKGTKPTEFDVEKWVYMIPFDQDVDGAYE